MPGAGPGARVSLRGAPAGPLALLEPRPEGVKLLRRPANDLEMAHLFVPDRATLTDGPTALRLRIVPARAGGASWPKKASKLMEDVIRAAMRSMRCGRG